MLGWPEIIRNIKYSMMWRKNKKSVPLESEVTDIFNK